MGRKFGGLCPVFWGCEQGPHPAQCGLDQGSPPRQMPSSSIKLFYYNRHGPKIGGGSAAFLGRGELGPHLTESRLGRGLPPYQVAS